MLGRPFFPGVMAALGFQGILDSRLIRFCLGFLYGGYSGWAAFGLRHYSFVLEIMAAVWDAHFLSSHIHSIDQGSSDNGEYVLAQG